MVSNQRDLTTMIDDVNMEILRRIIEYGFHIHDRYKPGDFWNINRKVLRKAIFIPVSPTSFIGDLRKTGYFDSVTQTNFASVEQTAAVHAILKPRKGRPVLEYLQAYKNMTS